MSVVMDCQDLVGYVRGLCLVAIVHRAKGKFSRVSAECIAKEHIFGKLARFADALHGFAGIDASLVVDVMNALVANGADETYFEIENVNIQLSLLSGQPIPPYPFVEETHVDAVALLRPYLDVSTNLLHAAVRLRMQSVVSLSSAREFWPEAMLFLDCMWGASVASSAIARTTVASVASDVLFYNVDIGLWISLLV